MKCRDCGAEVGNLGYLKKHKAECPGRESLTAETLNRVIAEMKEAGAYIPLEQTVITATAGSVAAFKAMDETATAAGDAALDNTGFIPYSLCAEELPTLGVGTTVVLQVVGRLIEGGIVVEEAELL